MSTPYSGTFEWEIRHPLLTKMLLCKNGTEFESSSFKISNEIEFNLIVYPNGHSKHTENSFIFGLTLYPWPSHIDKIVICRSQYCKQTGSSSTCINTYSANNNSFGWLSRRLLLSELKQMGYNLKVLQIGVSLNILQIKLKKESLYIYPLQFSNITNISYINNINRQNSQQIEWKIADKKLKLFKLSYYGKRYESQVLSINNNGSKWMMACYPNGYKSIHEGYMSIFIRLCCLPPATGQIYAKFKIKCIETNHEWNGQHWFKYDDASVGNVKFIKFNQISSLKAITLIADIMIGDNPQNIIQQQQLQRNTNNMNLNANNINQHQQVHSGIYSQLKQNRYEIDLLKHQNNKLIQKLTDLQRKFHLMQMTPIQEETSQDTKKYIEDEKSNDDNNRNHNQRRDDIARLSDELLLYQQKFSSLQQQLRQNQDDDGNLTKGGADDDKQTEELSEKQRELQQWLMEIDLNEYFEILVLNGFDDLETIKMITMTELGSIGIEKLGHQLKLIKYVNALKQSQETMGNGAMATYYQQDINLAYEKHNAI